MKTIIYKAHPLFPGCMYYYLQLNGKTVSIWENYGEAVEKYLEI